MARTDRFGPVERIRDISNPLDSQKEQPSIKSTPKNSSIQDMRTGVSARRNVSRSSLMHAASLVSPQIMIVLAQEFLKKNQISGHTMVTHMLSA